MNNILFVNGCVRGDSRTLMLARKVLSKISGNITELKLNDASLLTGIRCRSGAVLLKPEIFHRRCLNTPKHFLRLTRL